MRLYVIHHTQSRNSLTFNVNAFSSRPPNHFRCVKIFYWINSFECFRLSYLNISTFAHAQRKKNTPETILWWVIKELTELSIMLPIMMEMWKRHESVFYWCHIKWNGIKYRTVIWNHIYYSKLFMPYFKSPYLEIK